MEIREKLKEYFLRYTAVPSQSLADAPQVPSTPGQTVLAEMLAGDLYALGLCGIEISEYSVVTAHLPARLPEGCGKVPVIGWCCHMDTVDVGLSPVIKPVLVRSYPGGDICQNEDMQIYISAGEHP